MFISVVIGFFIGFIVSIFTFSGEIKKGAKILRDEDDDEFAKRIASFLKKQE